MTAIEIYAVLGNFIWALVTTIVIYIIMKVMKKTFVSVTNIFSSTDKGRRTANTILGAFMSIGMGTFIGGALNILFPINIHLLWFTLGGLLANYTYLMVERIKDANKMAMADAVADAVHESNKTISETDFPAITAKVKTLTEAFKTSESNVHAKEVSEVATGIAGAVGISQEEIDKVTESIANLKRAGLDVSQIEALWEQCKSDGKITPQERSIVMQACEILRQKYGK